MKKILSASVLAALIGLMAFVAWTQKDQSPPTPAVPVPAPQPVPTPEPQPDIPPVPNPPGELPPDTKPVPPPTADRPPFAKGIKGSKFSWLPEWDDIVSKALDAYAPNLMDGSKVKGDIVALCPNYFSSTRPQKKAFWALFLASIAKPESNYDPHSIYWEGAMTRPRHSEGLFQLSYGDQPNNPACKIVKTGGTESPGHIFDGNIQDPEVNITCAVSILDKQVWDAKKGISRGLWPQPKAYYWSVCTTNGGAKVKAQFARYRDQLAFCGTPKPGPLNLLAETMDDPETWQLMKNEEHKGPTPEARQ